MASKELETFAQYERYYDAAGIRTRCFEKGDGKPIILLHGAGGHADSGEHRAHAAKEQHEGGDAMEALPAPIAEDRDPQEKDDGAQQEANGGTGDE